MKNLFGQLNYSMLKRSSLGVHSKKRIENRSSDEGERGKTVKLRKVKSGSRFGDLGRRPARSPAGCPGRRQREPPNLRASSARPNSPELVPTRPVPTQLDPTTNFHVVLEQLTISPWNNLMFMIYYGLVIEGRPWIQTKSKIKKEYPTVMYTAWTFWPVVGWINHQYVPLQFRVILQSTVACFWGIFLNLRAKSLTLPKK